MQEFNNKLVVLVATKDRPAELMRFLQSLSKSTVMPERVIIVYSGIDISHNVQPYKSNFNLQIVPSSVSSQVFQKKLGLAFLPAECEWVLFLDDDVILESETIEVLFRKYVDDDKYIEYVGFGLAIRDRKYRKINILIKLFLYLVKIYSFTPGYVTKGGHPQIYLNLKVSSQVQWLNGISLWHRSQVIQYEQVENTAEYSAYEDVMFSYKISRNRKILFASDVYVQDQMQQHEAKLTYKQFVSGTYARYKFVNSYPEFSKFWLVIGQFARSLDYILWGKREIHITKRAKNAVQIYCVLVSIVVLGKNPETLLDL